jgi:hypothetical protein
MLPIQTVQPLRYAPTRGQSYCNRSRSILFLIVTAFLISPQGLSQDTTLTFSVSEEESPDYEASAAPHLWSADEVVGRAIQADPLRIVMLHERRLSQSQRSSHKSNCAVQNWVTDHLDQRIARREQEVRAQALKLHFGLAEIQSQTLVLDELRQLLTQYSEMVEKVAAAQEATDVLTQQREELTSEIRTNESSLHYSLGQIRAQLRGLLQCKESQTYWPAEPLIIHFQEVDVEHQVALAKQQRTDVSVWQAIPRIEGNADELTKVEKLLAASWLVVPTTNANSMMLKLLAHNRTSNDLKRQWSIRKQQIQELARAKTVEMETEVRLKALTLNQAYRSAQEAQLGKQQAALRLDTLQQRQELGVAQPDRYWEAAFQLQRARSKAFRSLGDARQAEIELDFATASQRSWVPKTIEPDNSSAVSEE